MSTYRKIHGRSIQAVTTDPSKSVAEGQVWYNTTSDTFKSVVNLEAFTSSTPYTTGRRSFGSAGTQTANLIFGGASATTATEEYNGSGWANGGAFGSAGYAVRGMGTQTAALSAGLFPPGGFNSATYKYDGSTWTSAGALPANRASMGTAGTQTAGLAFGGSGGPAFVNTVNSTYEYDGSSWTAGNNLNTGRTYLGGFGTQTAAAGCGGYTGSPGNDTQTGATEEYDGTNWTTSGSMNTARRSFATSGIQTAGLAIGGTTGSDSAVTEKYDGSTWATSPATLGTATRNNGGSPAGTQSAAISTEGGSSPYGAKTEEFNSSINTFTAAAWASGDNMNTARRGIFSAKNATQDAALGAMGYTGANTGVNNAEEYDGSSWTNVSTVPTSRYFGGGFGIQTAGVVYGGYRAPSQRDTTDEWDGSSWSTGGTLPSGQSNFAADGCGILTAGLSTLGMPGPAPATIHYDGSSWTAVPGTLNTPRTSGSSFGTQTAAIAATGNVPGSPGNTLTSESYNGTAWTATSNAIYGGYGNGCGGTQTAGFIGGTYPNGTTSQGWDGSSWFTIPSISTGRSESGGAGTSTAGIIFAGSTTNPTTYTAATEEFTGETTALNVKTLTQS